MAIWGMRPKTDFSTTFGRLQSTPEISGRIVGKMDTQKLVNVALYAALAQLTMREPPSSPRSSEVMALKTGRTPRSVDRGSLRKAKKTTAAWLWLARCMR